MSDIIVIAHNIRSTYNIGAIFRTCDGFGVREIILSGYSPYPIMTDDDRLPHIATKQTAQIAKTALGAERTVPCSYVPAPPLAALKQQGYTIVGLEQDERSIELAAFIPANKIALVIGEEVAGLAHDLRDQCDALVEIPMKGKKESFNVSVATGIALYGLTLHI